MKGFFAWKKQGCSVLICMDCANKIGILLAMLFSLLSSTLLNVCISLGSSELLKIHTFLENESFFSVFYVSNVYFTCV